MKFYVVINPKYQDADGNPRVTVRTTKVSKAVQVPGWTQVEVEVDVTATAKVAKVFKP